MISAKPGKPKLTLKSVLGLLPSAGTEADVIGKIREPNAIRRFNPGDTEDAYALNTIGRKGWADMLIFEPPALLDSLPLGTKMLVYTFGYHPQRLAGVLLVFVDAKGQILGWSYSRELDKLKDFAVLDDLRRE
jgi:hypothetical protein